MTAIVTAGVPKTLNLNGHHPIQRMLATIQLAFNLKTVFESTEDRAIRLQRARAVLEQTEL